MLDIMNEHEVTAVDGSRPELRNDATWCISFVRSPLSIDVLRYLLTLAAIIFFEDVDRCI